MPRNHLTIQTRPLQKLEGKLYLSLKRIKKLNRLVAEYGIRFDKTYIGNKIAEVTVQLHII